MLTLNFKLLFVSLILVVTSIFLPDTAQAQKTEVNVATWNFACRDVVPFWLCENCGTRFQHIANAIRGGQGYKGLPDFDSLDIILGQELLTDNSQIQVITDALKTQGFHHVTPVSPKPNSPQCGSPLQPHSGPKLGDSGGLVMWSKHPVVSFKTRRWCVNGFPTHGGYTIALVQVAGRYVVAVNLHAMPEYNLAALKAKDIRTYQFSEIANQLKELEADLRVTGAPFTIVVGGDFNEDLYSLRGKSQNPSCSLISSSDVKRKFNALGFDPKRSCEKSLVGRVTWDPTGNDLAQQFSKSGTHELLDLVLMQSSSETEYDLANIVYSPQYTPGWGGIFCKDTAAGFFKGLYFDVAQALSDHQLVTAVVPLPNKQAISSVAVSTFNRTFDQFPTDKAACGQSGTACLKDSNCCRETEYSFDNRGYQCSYGKCKTCKAEGERCNWLAQGSECCAFNQYPGGLHCEYSRCVRKFRRGQWCMSDAECDSGDCRWHWWYGPRCR